MYFPIKTLSQLQDHWGPVCFYGTLWEQGPVGVGVDLWTKQSCCESCQLPALARSCDPTAPGIPDLSHPTEPNLLSGTFLSGLYALLYLADQIPAPDF